jgi:hypothetical protein
MRTIVIAWLDKRAWLRSYGKPLAAVWMNVGTAQDLRNARAYAKCEGYRVFVYQCDTLDPLGRARAELAR